MAALAEDEELRAATWSDEEEGEATPFLFAEALEHLDRGRAALGRRARARLEEFRA